MNEDPQNAPPLIEEVHEEKRQTLILDYSRLQPGLTQWQAALTIMSTIMGGTIVGFPRAIFSTGIPLGVAITILMGF